MHKEVPFLHIPSISKRKSVDLPPSEDKTSLPSARRRWPRVIPRRRRGRRGTATPWGTMINPLPRILPLSLALVRSSRLRGPEILPRDPRKNLKHMCRTNPADKGLIRGKYLEMRSRKENGGQKWRPLSDDRYRLSVILFVWHLFAKEKRSETEQTREWSD